MKKGTLLPSQFERGRNSLAEFADLYGEMDKIFEAFGGALGTAEGCISYVGFDEAVRAAANVQAQRLRSVLGRQAQFLGFLKHRYEREIELVDNLAKSRDLTSRSCFMPTSARKQSSITQAKCVKRFRFPNFVGSGPCRSRPPTVSFHSVHSTSNVRLDARQVSGRECV